MNLLTIIDGKNTAWKKRYLVLSDAKHTNTKSMIYFESDSNGGSKKKGEINLMGLKVSLSCVYDKRMLH